MNSIDKNLIGFVLAFVTSLFAVVYTDDRYDAWDALFAGVSIWICMQLRDEIRRDPPANRSAVILGRITLGIASLVILMVGIALFNPELSSNIEKMKWSIFDAELGIAAVLTLLMIPVYPGKK
jgi:hypothetical protein